MHVRQLERCSECVTVDAELQQRVAEDPCIVCLAAFEVGEHARRLPRCGHIFHQKCVDKWLLRPGRGLMACPLCSSEVGVERYLEDESDPLVSRELAWLAELLRGHPGMLLW